MALFLGLLLVLAPLTSARTPVRRLNVEAQGKVQPLPESSLKAQAQAQAEANAVEEKRVDTHQEENGHQQIPVHELFANVVAGIGSFFNRLLHVFNAPQAPVEPPEPSLTLHQEQKKQEARREKRRAASKEQSEADAQPQAQAEEPSLTLHQEQKKKKRQEERRAAAKEQSEADAQPQAQAEELYAEGKPNPPSHAHATANDGGIHITTHQDKNGHVHAHIHKFLSYAARGIGSFFYGLIHVLTFHLL
jgi:cytoskeletal protein RodZ